MCHLQPGVTCNNWVSLDAAHADWLRDGAIWSEKVAAVAAPHRIRPAPSNLLAVVFGGTCPCVWPHAMSHVHCSPDTSPALVPITCRPANFFCWAAPPTTIWVRSACSCERPPSENCRHKTSPPFPPLPFPSRLTSVSPFARQLPSVTS